MKKITAILLSVVLMLGLVPVSALAADTCNCGYAPVIRVCGLGNQIYSGDTVVFPPQTSTIVSAVAKAIPATPALLSGVLRERQQERILAVAGTFFAPIAFDKNGEPANDAAARFTWPETVPHGHGEMIDFDYDWRMDPFAVAAQLKDFIEYVKAETGHSTVYLVGESMGTCEMNAYLAEYGFDDVAGVVWYNGAYNGVASCGDSFANRNNFTEESLAAFFKQLSVSGDQQFLYDLFTALQQAGLLATVLDSVVNGADTLAAEGMFTRFLQEYIGRIPGFWALVGPENYPAARAFAFPTPESQQEYAGLLQKLDRYYNEVSSKVDDIMQAAADATGKVGVVCGYGEYMPPVTADNTRQSDSVILTEDESNGATCAPLGQTLGENYVQKVNDGHNHLSPDGVIDASTAFFPDNTWFVKYGHHSFSGASELVNRIFTVEGFNVFTDAAYPQFMAMDTADWTMHPLVPDTDSGKTMDAGFTAALLKALFKVTDFFLRIYKFFATLGR